MLRPPKIGNFGYLLYCLTDLRYHCSFCHQGQRCKMCCNQGTRFPESKLSCIFQFKNNNVDQPAENPDGTQKTLITESYWPFLSSSQRVKTYYTALTKGSKFNSKAIQVFKTPLISNRVNELQLTDIYCTIFRSPFHVENSSMCIIIDHHHSAGKLELEFQPG